jgi:quinol monooxygenase YgiN
MTLLIIGTIRLPVENFSDARVAMRTMIEASLAEDGCLEYGYAQDVLDLGLIHVKERWRDRPSLDRHFASDHIAAWRSAWPALGIGDRVLLLYDVGVPTTT